MCPAISEPIIPYSIIKPNIIADSPLLQPKGSVKNDMIVPIAAKLPEVNPSEAQRQIKSRFLQAYFILSQGFSIFLGSVAIFEGGVGGTSFYKSIIINDMIEFTIAIYKNKL